MNYFHDAAQAKARMTQLVNEAETARLATPQAGMTDHLLTTVGAWMISTGERLTRLSAVDINDKKLSVIETANG